MNLIQGAAQTSVCFKVPKVYQWVQAAKTKYHKLCGSNTRHLFLSVLENEKSKIKGLAYLILDKDSGVSLPGLETTFSLYPHIVERKKALVSLSLLIRTLVPSRGSTLMTSSKTDYLSCSVSHGSSIFKTQVVYGSKWCLCAFLGESKNVKIWCQKWH